MNGIDATFTEWLHCRQGVSNNYETDLLRPIMDCTAELAGISYDTADEKSRTSLKVKHASLREAAANVCMVA